MAFKAFVFLLVCLFVFLSIYVVVCVNPFCGHLQSVHFARGVKQSLWKKNQKEEAQSSSNVVDLTTRCKMGNCQRGIVEQLTRSRK